MVFGEVVAGEAAGFEQYHRQRVAEGERGRGARGRGELERARFAGDAVKQQVIGGTREVGIRVGGEGHDEEAEALEQRDETENLFGLTAVAEQNCKIALGAQTEVTVERLG